MTGRPRMLASAAMFMGAALGIAAAAPAARMPAARNAATEFLAPTRRKRSSKKKAGPHQKKRDPQKSEPWQRLRGGWMRDGRGDLRSPKRLRRQQVCLALGITSGRQWVRARRALTRMGSTVARGAR